jgi:putative ABC transport system permease protein
MELIKKLTYKNLKLNKKRSTVTIIGIVLSVALLTALSSLALSFYYTVLQEAKDSYGNFHYYFSGIAADKIADFENNRDIDSMYVTSSLGYAKIEGVQNEYKPYACIVGTDKSGFENLSLNLVEGRMPENENEIVIPRHLKTNGRVDIAVGSEVTLEVGERQLLSVEELTELLNQEEYSELTDEEKAEVISDVQTYYDSEQDLAFTQDTQLQTYAIDETEITIEKLVNTTEKTYKVVGIIERPSYGIEPYSASGYTFVTYCDNPQTNITVYARYTKKALRNRTKVTAAILGVDEELFEKVFSGKSYESVTTEDVENIYAQIEENGIDFDSNAYLIECESLWPLSDTMKSLLTIIVIVALIIIVTSVYCIKNSFGISVSEKIRQYGMLSSIGATKKQIKKSVLYEGWMLGIIGIPLGLISGVGAAYVLIKITTLLLGESLNVNLIFKPSYVAIIASLLLGILTIYFSAIGSARRASKISPIAAIRSQNEIKVKAKKLKTPKWVGKLWGIGGVVSYKNIKRNKRKYRTTVVSIVICTATFIAISYFMSMAFDLVKQEAGEYDYNLSVTFWLTDENESQALINNILTLDNIDSYNECRVKTVYSDNTKKTDLYIKSLMGEDESNKEYCENALECFDVVCVSDECYKEYLKEIGLSESDCVNKAILINDLKTTIYNKEKGKYYDATIDVFDYKAGDTLDLYVEDYTNADWDEEEGKLVGAEKKEFKLSLAAVTDERPLGFKNSYYGNTYLIVNRDTLKYYGLEDLYTNHDINIYITSSNPDVLQDDIENLITAAGKDDTGVYVDNIDSEVATVKALFTLVGIFAYGFITVIALIGITNIINTISTGMELRSSEFATLRSIGMTNKEFNRMIRLESILTGAKALIFGIPIGLGLSYIIYRVEALAVRSFTPPLKAVMLCVLAVFILIFCIMKLSLSKINKKNIIEAIKNENV